MENGITKMLTMSMVGMMFIFSFTVYTKMTSWNSLKDSQHNCTRAGYPCIPFLSLQCIIALYEITKSIPMTMGDEHFIVNLQIWVDAMSIVSVMILVQQSTCSIPFLKI